MAVDEADQAVERNIKLTQTVLDELRSEAWHELHAAAAVVIEEVQHAQEIGGVTDSVWNYLQAQSSLATLQKHRARHLDDLQRRRTAWLASGERSAEWFRDNYNEVLRDGQSVLAAQQAIALHHVLRVAHLRRSDDDTDHELATAVLASARTQHLQTAELLDRALRDMHASLALWYDASPGDRVTVAGAKVPLREVVEAVRALHDRAVDGPFSHLARLEEPSPASVAHFVSVAERDRPMLTSRLRWVLAPAEQAHLVAYGSFSFGDGDTRRLLVVTDRRALMLDWSDLKGGVARTKELPKQAAFTLTRKDKRERVEVSCDGRSGLLVADESPSGGLMSALTRWQQSALEPAEEDVRMLI